MVEVKVIQDDLVRQAVDLVVNPVRPNRLSQGSVDHAVREAAGPQMGSALAELRAEEGALLVTPGFQLPARRVVHVVVPSWANGADRAERRRAYLASCRSWLRAADHVEARTIAVPALGVGAQGWPIDLAADLVAEALADWIDEAGNRAQQIRLVCASPAMVGLYARAVEDWELPTLCCAEGG